MKFYTSASRHLTNAPRSLRRLSTQPSRGLSLPHRNHQSHPPQQTVRFQSSDASSSESPTLVSSTPEATPTPPSDNNETVPASGDTVSPPVPDSATLGPTAAINSTTVPGSSTHGSESSTAVDGAENEVGKRGDGAGNVPVNDEGITRASSTVGEGGDGGVEIQSSDNGTVGNNLAMEELFVRTSTSTDIGSETSSAFASSTSADASSATTHEVGASDPGVDRNLDSLVGGTAAWRPPPSPSASQAERRKKQSPSWMDHLHSIPSIMPSEPSEPVDGSLTENNATEYVSPFWPTPPKRKPTPASPLEPPPGSKIPPQPPILAQLTKPNRKRKRAEITEIRDRIKKGETVPKEELGEYIKYLEGGAIDFWDKWDSITGRSSNRKSVTAAPVAAKTRSFDEGVSRKGGSEDKLDYENYRELMKRREIRDELVAKMRPRDVERKSETDVTSENVDSTGVTGAAARHGVRAWESGWGKDKLEPLDASDSPSREPRKEARSVQDGDETRPVGEPWRTIPNIKFNREINRRSLPNLPFTARPSPLIYTRRIEGILEPDKMGEILEEVEPPSEQLPVVQLSHNLDRVLFNPGVHWLQDPRSRVFNFSPYLQEIPPVHDFAFERVDTFTRPSKDTDIHTLLKKHNKKFSGSTSSLSGILCHLYFLVSGDRLVNTTMMSREFSSESRTFTSGQRMPTSVVFRGLKEGESESGGTAKYAVDAAGGADGEKNILTWLGTMLEKFVTVPREQFDGYLRSKTDVPLPEKSDKREAFRFSKTNNFIMRSQLDCHDPRLPGSGVFDIKTRACVPIRLDIFNYEENSGYLIRTQQGKYESFEREYYDLIRSAFLKYQFQVRIGGMDGVIVAYHNTKRMFGFQYVPLEEMDDRLFGPGQGVGDRMFKGCVSMLENVAEEVVGCFPNQDVKATFETLEGSHVMNIWVEPVEWEGDSEKSPMKQLEVRVWNHLDSSILTKAWEAFREMNHNWTIRWSIAQMNLTPSEVRGKYLGAKRRQLRAWAMPTGVDPEDIKEWYESLNFAGSENGGAGATFRPERFVSTPYPGVTMLREMAREGARETERIREEEAGKPQHVL